MRSDRKLLNAVLLGLTACLLLCGQENRLERGRTFLGLAPPPDPAAAARGEKIFVQNCAFCHGQDARGAEGPNLIRSATVLHDEKGETLGPVLRRGFPDKGMPAFSQLTDEQSYDIASFLHARVEAAANRYGYKLQNIVTGDANAGKTYFAANCQSCHSATGDLAHVGSKYEPADLQAKFLYPGDSAAPLTATVTLPTGENVTGVLKRIDDFQISITDETGAYRSWQTDAVKYVINDPLLGHQRLLAKYTDSDMHNILAYLVTLK
jgi:mono/diheme cytochrome c family protein